MLEQQRYYRLVLPMEPDKPALSSHPLTWTTISHVIWDGCRPTRCRSRSSRRCWTGCTGAGR